MTEATTPPQPQAPAAAGRKKDQGRKPQRTIHPALHTLFELYPRLFGARFLPLKVGIYDELMAAHPDRFKPEDLKGALQQHTRSNRYLEAVACGLPRHDLQGQPVEPVAPEHVHHAITELYRRKANTPQEALARTRAVQQLVAAIDRSGLGREGYRERFGLGGHPSARALLEEALDVVAQRSARQEAMKRAYAASGKSVEEFAEMYGMAVAEVRQLVG